MLIYLKTPKTIQAVTTLTQNCKIDETAAAGIRDVLGQI